MTPLAHPPLRADAQRNKQRILAAATDLFQARGLDVSMEDIAREAGVGVGTLYRRFQNRDELIDALFESRLVEFTEIVRSCAAVPDGWTGMVMLLERTLQAQAADRGLKHLFHSRDNLGAAVAELRDLVLDELQRMISSAQAAGEMRRDVSAMDVALISLQVGSLADVTADLAPGAWRRALAISLDGLRPAGAGALPPGPIDRSTFEAALECWRPPAPPGHPTPGG